MEVLENNFDDVSGSLLLIQSIQNGTEKLVELIAIDLDNINDTILLMEVSVTHAELRSMDNSDEVIKLDSIIGTLSARITAADARIADLENA